MSLEKYERELHDELTKPTEDAIAPGELKAVAGEEWPEIENDDATLEALATACEGATNPKISVRLRPYRFRLKNGKGGGIYLTPAATLEEARAELLRRWPDELLVVTKAGRTC